MNALSINIQTIKRIMNESEAYSIKSPGEPFTIIYCVQGYRVGVTGHPHNSHDDADVTYYFDGKAYNDYDSMFEAVAHDYMKSYL